MPLLVEIAIMPNISFVDAGWGSTCAADADGRLVCWGYNVHGQLGYEDTTQRGGSAGDMANLQFVDLGLDFAVESISAGLWHRCALSTIREMKVYVCVTVLGIKKSTFLHKEPIVSIVTSFCIGYRVGAMERLAAWAAATPTISATL